LLPSEEIVKENQNDILLINLCCGHPFGLILVLYYVVYIMCYLYY